MYAFRSCGLWCPDLKNSTSTISRACSPASKKRPNFFSIWSSNMSVVNVKHFRQKIALYGPIPIRKHSGHCCQQSPQSPPHESSSEGSLPTWSLTLYPMAWPFLG